MDAEVRRRAEAEAALKDCRALLEAARADLKVRMYRRMYKSGQKWTCRRLLWPSRCNLPRASASAYKYSL
eukprot:2845586-Pyramimonas_sp.AAC.1